MLSTINLTTKLWPGRSQALRENPLLLSDAMMAQQAAFCSPLDSQISTALTPHHRCSLSQWMMVNRDSQLVQEQRTSDPGVVSPKWDIYSPSLSLTVQWAWWERKQKDWNWERQLQNSLPDITEAIVLMNLSCGWSNKPCTWSSQSTFQRGWCRGSQGLSPNWETIDNWWLLEEGESFSSGMQSLVG